MMLEHCLHSMCSCGRQKYSPHAKAVMLLVLIDIWNAVNLPLMVNPRWIRKDNCWGKDCFTEARSFYSKNGRDQLPRNKIIMKKGSWWKIWLLPRSFYYLGLQYFKFGQNLSFSQFTFSDWLLSLNCNLIWKLLSKPKGWVWRRNPKVFCITCLCTNLLPHFI